MSSAASAPVPVLSVIIPVYNERRTVRALLDRVVEAPLSIGKELVIVNDGSTDGSDGIIREWLADNPAREGLTTLYLEKENGGKGSAVRHGIQQSKGAVVIIQDADLEYDPADYEACIAPILEGRCSVVYGSREKSNANRIYSAPSFYLGGLSLTVWMNFLYNIELSDEPTCYKTFDGPLIRAMPLEGNRFDWEPEVTAKVARLGFEIIEVPVIYKPRPIHDGKKIRWIDGVEAFWVALKWLAAPLGKVRAAVQATGGHRASIVADNARGEFALMLTVLGAILIHLLFAWPALADTARLMRPDSNTYLDPARSLLGEGAFNTSLGSVSRCSCAPRAIRSSWLSSSPWEEGA